MSLRDLPRDESGRLVAPPIAPVPPPPDLPAGGFVAVGDHRLWVVDSGGDGPAVVLLHPAVGSAALWAYQVPVLAAAGYRVLAYDRPGHGRSGAGPDQEHDPAAADCLALVDALGLGAVHLVGVAQGGRVAVEVALAAPERLRSLVLVASNGGVKDDRPLPLMPPGFIALPTWSTELGAAYRSVDPDGTKRWISLGNEHPPGLTAPARRIDPADLPTLDLPVLLVGGDADGFTPPPVVRALRDRFAGADLAILPECGHSPQWERPDLFNAALLRFLAER